MKKVIAAAAGLMLAGTMATAAFAEVSFKGDARARYYNQQDYNLVNQENSFWNSRVRLQWTGKSKGGAYAVGRFRLADAKWDGTQSNRKGADAGNLWVDKAYIGVPFGPVTIEAGLTYRNLTPFAYMWRGADAIDAIYKAENTTFRAFAQVLDEFEEDPVTGLTAADDLVDDDDVNAYGALLNQKFGGGWGLTAYAMVEDDNQASADGVRAGVKVDGAVAKATMAAEVAYVESDLQGTADDGLGAYVEATLPLGAASIYAVVGLAQDGFVIDDDFAGQGIVMGNYSQISGFGIGSQGDTTYVLVAPKFKASEKLTLGGVLGYYDIDGPVGDAFEVGAKASYAVVDGASLNALVGYADFDNADENPIGFGVSLEVSY